MHNNNRETASRWLTIYVGDDFRSCDVCLQKAPSGQNFTFSFLLHPTLLAHQLVSCGSAMSCVAVKDIRPRASECSSPLPGSEVCLPKAPGTTAEGHPEENIQDDMCEANFFHVMIIMHCVVCWCQGYTVTSFGIFFSTSRLSGSSSEGPWDYSGRTPRRGHTSRNVPSQPL